MKRTLIAIALSACLTTVAAAKQLYNITLSDTQRYTDCSIIIKSETETKFNGTDKDGFMISRTVKNDEILVMAPVVKEEPAPKPEAKEQTEEQPQAPEQPQEEVKPQDPAAQAQDQAQEQPKAEEPVEEATPVADAARDFKAISDSLHAQLDEADKVIATITTPKFSLERRAKRVRDMVERKLAEVETIAQQVQEAKDAANAKDAKPFSFDIVTPEQRTQYETDGKAAYDAMVADMKPGKNSRRVGGLSKFEDLRKNFKGIPEYKQAHAWYISTLKDLRKKWGKMRDAEDTRRRKAVGERRERMDQEDAKEIEKITKMLAAENEKYETAWITPSTHNARMLETAVSRVEDALRRNSNENMPDAVGRVPEMLKTFWDEMDQVKALMDAGECAKAKELLSKSDTFKELNRLNRDLLPETYRKPLLDQRRALENAVRERERDIQRAKRTLDSATARLDRAVENLNRQIEGLMTDVERTLQTNEENKEAEKAQQETEAKRAAEAEADEGEETGEDSADKPAEKEADTQAADEEKEAPAGDDGEAKE